jgi:hypothetical protein
MAYQTFSEVEKEFTQERLKFVNLYKDSNEKFIKITKDIYSLVNKGLGFNLIVCLLNFIRPSEGVFYTFISYSKIYKMLNKSKPTVSKCIHELIKENIITVFKKKNTYNRYICLNCYLKTFNIDIKDYHNYMCKKEDLILDISSSSENELKS